MEIYILLLAVGFIACTAAYILQGQKEVKGFLWIPIIITFFIPLVNCVITPWLITASFNDKS